MYKQKRFSESSRRRSVQAPKIICVLLTALSFAAQAQESRPLTQPGLLQRIPQQTDPAELQRPPDRSQIVPGRRQTPAAIRLIITTPSPLPQGTVGVPYSRALAVSGGHGPYAFSVASGKLPAGLLLSGSTIVGTPTGPGSSFVIRVTDTNLATTTKSFTVAITQPPPPKITTASPLPPGTSGVPYSQIFTASGGTAPYTFSLSSGAVPPGLSLKGATLSGIPVGSITTYTFALKVTDSALQTDTKTFSLKIVSGPPKITTASPLPSATSGVSYSQTFAATGGAAPYTFSLSSGAVPPGLSLKGATLSGTPAVGTTVTLTFDIKLTDSALQTDTKTFSLAVVGPPTITTANPLPDTSVGAPYYQKFEAAGGKGPYSFSLESGTLPDGLNLDGLILTGYATTVGTFAFTIKVTDANTVTQTKNFSLTVSPAPVITTPSPLPPGVVGIPYQFSFAAEKGVAPYTFSMPAGKVPDGLKLTGPLLTGTPTTTGESIFTIIVNDVHGAYSYRDFSIMILVPSAPPSIPKTIAIGTPLTATGYTADQPIIPKTIPIGTPLTATGYTTDQPIVPKTIPIGTPLTATGF